MKAIGDGFFVAFQSANEAVECAVAIQRALQKRLLTLLTPTGASASSKCGMAAKPNRAARRACLRVVAAVAGRDTWSLAEAALHGWPR